MKMHEHVTCKYKCTMSSAQSNPSSTQHSNKVNTHLICMKHCYNAHVMQCMVIQDQIYKTHPKNLAKTSLILKNLKTFQKPQKVRSQDVKCMMKRGIKDLTSEEEHNQGRRTLGNEVWSEREEFGR